MEQHESNGEMYRFDAHPKDTVPLLRLSLRKLQDFNPEESERLFKASKDLGFFYLDLDGADNSQTMLQDVDALFSLGEKLFNEELEPYDFGLEGSYFGYKGYGKGTINKAGDRDRNEFFNVSKDDILSLSSPLPSPCILTAHRPLLSSFIQSTHTIATLLLTHIESHLHLPQGTLPSLHRLLQPSGDQIRFTHAPPQPLSDQRVALGGHTDFGSLTVLFNRLGGLQVLPPNTEKWKYVRPLPGHAIINLGDAMSIFTNGLLRSNIHRVAPPPGRDSQRERYSVVYFSRPEDGVLLRKLEGAKGVIPPLKQGEREEEVVDAKTWVLRRAMARRGGDTVGFDGTERGKL